MRRFFRFLPALALVSAAFAAAAGTVCAQSIRIVAPQRVSVKADAVPVGDLLDVLNDISPVPSLNLDPAERSIPVSLEVEDVRAIDAMFLVLKESKLDFVMSSRGIWAGRAKKAAQERGDAAFAAARTAPGPTEPAAPAPIDSGDEFGRDSVPYVPFTVRGDSVTIQQTGFVPLKLLPEVVKRRMAMDLAKIP